MQRSHAFELSLTWTGDRGSGTSGYRDYARDHLLQAPGKADIAGSSDPAFRGDPSAWSPEELLVASLSQCHLLWYLHLATSNGVVVTAYADQASGSMDENEDGSGQFTGVTLRPAVTVADASMVDAATALHAEVGRYCFIARSVSFPVRHVPTTTVSGTSGS